VAKTTKLVEKKSSVVAATSWNSSGCVHGSIMFSVTWFEAPKPTQA
jgi:hypothetical protein